MSNHLPNSRIFRLNDIVRNIVREQLALLEEPITKIAIQAFRKVIEQEEATGDDLFACLDTITQSKNVRHLQSYEDMPETHNMSLVELVNSINKNGPGKIIQSLSSFSDDMSTFNDMSMIDGNDIVFSDIPTGTVNGNELELPVIVKNIDGQDCYVFCEDNKKTVHIREIDDDGQSQVGDLIGVIDDDDLFWKVELENGVVCGYSFEDQYVPAERNTLEPIWEGIGIIDETD